MKARIISGIIGFILLVSVIWGGRIVLGLAVTALALIALHEFYTAISCAGFKPFGIIGYVSCIPIFLISINGAGLLQPVNWLIFGMFAVLVVLLSIMIFRHKEYTLTDISLTVFGILYIPFLFSFIVLTRDMNIVKGAANDEGFFLVWLIFIGAFATDTFAYFCGVSFGRKKILPEISPKKSLEGTIGGALGCILVTALYGVFLRNRSFIAYIPLYHFVILGVLNGVLSQIGDWAASAIKRQVKIKDYGKIMPGHGGVLDRFDSILFTAPVVYFYISFLIQGV